MIDARLLFDVHFQQGKRPKDPQGSAAHAEEHPAPPHKPHSEEWHSEQEQLASIDSAEKEKPLNVSQ